MKQHSPEFLNLVRDALSRIEEISVEEVMEKMKGKEELVLLDVREDSEWILGRAKGALHMGRGILERDIEGRFPDKATPLVLYCGGGFRSALAADNLKKMGYQNVKSMAGGWSAWVGANGQVEREDGART